MKNVIKLSAALALAFILVLGSAFTIQKDSFKKEAAISSLSTQSDIIASGCVGQCGFSFSSEAVVTAAGNNPYQFIATSDLCDALGAKVLITKNGNTVFLGDVEQGAIASFDAKAGDVISMQGEIFVKARVLCYPRGQVDMQITQI